MEVGENTSENGIRTNMIYIIINANNEIAELYKHIFLICEYMKFFSKYPSLSLNYVTIFT